MKRETYECSELEVKLSNNLEGIAFVRMLVRRLLPPLDEVQEPLLLGALSEVVTNAIEEHVRIGSEAYIEVTLSLGPEPKITITDHGTGFEPELRPSTTHTGAGLGLIISKAVVPEMQITSGRQGTTVVFPYPEEAV